MSSSYVGIDTFTYLDENALNLLYIACRVSFN